MLAEGVFNSAFAPPLARGGSSTSPAGEVRPQAGAEAAAFSTESPSSSSSTSPPDHSAASASPLPRRAVPLTFSPIINDEANILCHIARGDFTLAELAIKYETTVSAFCLWLQRDDIQQKLNDLTTAGATLTRIAAVNQLPRAVTAMTAQIDGYEFDRAHNLIKPGLAADKVAALRDANIRKACTLLLRLARFDPSQPVYRKREPASRALNKLPQGGAVDRATASETEGAPAFAPASSTCSSSRPLSFESDVIRGIELPLDDAAPLHAPSRPATDLASLCTTARAAVAESRFADSALQGRDRAGEPSVPLPLSSNHESTDAASQPQSHRFEPLEHSNGAHRYEPHTAAESLDDPHSNGHARRNGRAPPRASASSWL